MAFLDIKKMCDRVNVLMMTQVNDGEISLRNYFDIGGLAAVERSKDIPGLFSINSQLDAT